MGLFDSLLPFGSMISSALSFLDSRSNRAFQERMSSTAHQREVRDMLAAGINPIMSARSSGASTPAGSTARIEDISSSALAVRMNRAQVKLVESSAEREAANAMLARVQAADIQSTAAAGRMRRITAQADIADMDAEQRRAILPLARQRAEAEIESMSSAAEAARARAVLDQLSSASAEQLAKFADRMGEFGPALRFLIELMRARR